MEKNISKKTVVSSLIWKFLERGGVQGVQFLLSIVLARLVSPTDYGIIAILLVFIQIANVFVQSGFNTALIQKRDSDEKDFSTIFYLTIFIVTILYCIIFLCAPFISKIYRNEKYTSLLRVLAITLFFGSINSVQNSYVSKTMQFRRLFFSSMGACIGSGIIGIILAYNGFGVWALVFQQLIRELITCIILWVTVKWRPILFFSFRRVKILFQFGWKLLCSSLLETVFRNIYSLLIGGIYDNQSVGFFNRGQQFPSIIASNLDGSIQSVMLPTLASHNDDIQEVKRITRRSINISAYILMPCMFGLAALATPIVRLLLTEKWLPCVPFLQLACICYSFYPIHTANLTGINALGRSDIFLKLEVTKKIITVLTILITYKFGILAMAIGQVVSDFFCTFLNASPNKRLMNYSYFEQMKDLFPSLICSLLMAISVSLLGFLNINYILLLVIQILVGIIIYVSLSILFKLESFKYLLKTLKDLKK